MGDFQPNFKRIASYPAPARLGLFILTLVLLWLPIAALLYLILREDANATTIATMGMLFVTFLVLVRLWGTQVYQQPHLLRRYGLEWTRLNGNDLLRGLSIGLIMTLSLFALMGVLGWLQFQPSPGFVRVVGEGFLSALGIGFAEELAFRGWLLDELERDYSPSLALGINAIAFATLHFLKPLAEVIRTFPQFPGLILLGLALVLAKRSRRGRLGIAIGLHAGLVWGYYILNVGQVVQYTDRVSPWITGVDGNPVAGVMGILGLSILALWMRTLNSGRT